MTKPVSLCLPIYQGATFDEQLERTTYPYAVREEFGQIVRADTGIPAPDSDATPEDYTGCSARMQLRPEIDSDVVIDERSTANGGIVLDGAKLSIRWSALETSAMVYGEQPSGWTRAIGQVEVTRPGGQVERQYEIAFTLHQEGTR
ncbi:MAG: hypothetical protein J7556_15130 [Acidovorax sp.]|nr:hypothetical protein [Acidovorax sp.]